MVTLRSALRSLRASPGLVTVAVLSLALGIGSNTAIFTLIHALILRPLPVPHPGELAQVSKGKTEFFSNPAWEQLRDRQDVFPGLFAWGRWKFNLASGGEVRYAQGNYVSGRFFQTLGVRAMLGRVLAPSDDVPGCAGAAVLSHRFWQREYRGSLDAVGQTISLGTHRLEIAGVTEPAFTGLDVGSSVDVMVPLCAEKIIGGQASVLDNPRAPWLRLIGRLEQGIEAEQAAARLNAHLTDEDRGQHLRFAVTPASTGLSFLRRQYRQALIVLLAIAGVVLLICCANVANLLLARGSARQRETAIRMALGCSKARLIGQALAESLLLAAAGAALGVVFASWSTALLTRYLDVYLDTSPDPRVLGFAMAAAVLSSLIFGVVPAWRGSSATARFATRSITGGRQFGLGKALVVAQVALSMLLVSVSGLMLGTLWKLASLDPGFDSARVLLASADIRNGRHTPERRALVFRQMLERVRAIPGVQSASLAAITPLSPARAMDQVTVGSRAETMIHLNGVSEDYFAALGTAPLAGRDFNPGDTPTSPQVAIVNQAMAAKFFGTASPVGATFRRKQGKELGAPYEIVGVVRDAKYESLRDEMPPTVYLSWSQSSGPPPIANLVIRTANSAPESLVKAVVAATGEVDPAATLDFTTMARQADQSIERERLLAALSAFFGGLSLLLAAMGLYGVISLHVTRRRAEIGIRMALGAERAGVLRMVLGEVTAMTGAGLALGILLALAGTRAIAGFLYQLSPTDPIALACAAAVQLAMSLAAGYWPARRAARVDPMVALRRE